MVTDADREFARRQANEIYRKCLTQGWGLQFQIATEINYEETMRRGVLCECAFAHEFNLPIRTQIFEFGDGGLDFPLLLATPSGTQSFKVNVKAKTVKTTFEVLSRYPMHLRVPVIECKPMTIYVFGLYYEPTDDAEVLRWDWGQTLIRSDERRVFENSNGIENYIRLFEKLRDLQELKDRMVPPEPPPPGDHDCHCGAYGPFGVGTPNQGRIEGVVWYCREHRPP